MISQAAGDLVRFGVRLHERGFVSATDGNLSARLSDGGFLTTPSGLPKLELTDSSLVRLDPDGAAVGSGKPSSEWPMHEAIYRSRPDVGAVVHAHPPFATALACAGMSLDSPVLSEVILSLGEVPLIPFALPSTRDLARQVARGLGSRSAALLANHGAVTVGDTPRSAYYRMETLEQAAQIHLYTQVLGGARPLPRESVEALSSMGTGYRLASAPGEPRESCPAASGEEGLFITRDRLQAWLLEFARLYARGALD